ncbi:MAG: hypothetical protein JSS30_04085 [Verrucomicrobia bacterium]|nr:hypothetical protein [Verrucomicrobiota bacterium]
MKKKMLIVFLVFFSTLVANHPFKHDLNFTAIPGKSDKVIITAHGMNGNHQISQTVKTDKTIVTFNFPDHDLYKRDMTFDKTTFGTIDELLPLLYVIKQKVLIDGDQEIDLYGFSAGGGAIINTLAALNTTRFDDHLQKLGIDQNGKAQMLAAIQKGTIILDCPLKSVREIIAFRGTSKDLELAEKRYKANDMEPIDAIKYLQGLKLDVTLYFNNPDETLSNRDDQLYYQELKKVNANGTTQLLIGKGGGHNTPHPQLWESLKK